MRLLAWVGVLLGGFFPAEAYAAPEASGNFYARIRANDAPLGGRFSIFAYFMDSLDVAVPMPGPGRVLALCFRESNGKSAFLIPGDLHLRARQDTRWIGGFLPLGEGRLGGRLEKDTSRWALWWVPLGEDTLLWSSPQDLELHYGNMKSMFVPLSPQDAAVTWTALPREALAGPALRAERTTRGEVSPDPATYDSPPQIKERRPPEYPESARMFDFHGSVLVVAVVNETGAVTDAFILQSNAIHELNVAALVAVMDWVFRPGKKSGKSVAGEMVIPIQFSLGGGR